MSEKTYGFIITRHVNNEKTNNYWNHCVKCIQRFYPYRKIVIIDDNSNQKLVKAEKEYKNVEVVQSEYPGRGELLPYYYFYKKKYFNNAVILHDSVFFHKRIAFEKINLPVFPLWHFDYNENIENTLELSMCLKNRINIQQKLAQEPVQLFAFRPTDLWHGCFGVQSYINHSFLSSLENKYQIFNLLKVVKNRSDRCCLERIMGAIFYSECQPLYKTPSLLGDIWKYCKWELSYEEYCKQGGLTGNRSRLPLIKVWSGR